MTCPTRCYKEIHCYICNVRTDVTNKVQRKRLPEKNILKTEQFKKSAYLIAKFGYSKQPCEMCNIPEEVDYLNSLLHM